jgi:hypothetical protein
VAAWVGRESMSHLELARAVMDDQICEVLHHLGKLAPLMPLTALPVRMRRPWTSRFGANAGVTVTELVG